MNELTTDLANEITRWHEQAQQHAQDSREQAEQALKAAVNCGQHIEIAQQMTKGQMLAWLRDNVPTLEPQQAKAYLSLLQVHRERESHAIDHRQLLLLGVIDKGEAVATSRSEGQDPGKWVGWVANVRVWFTRTTRERPVNEWTPDEREAVRNQLRPVVEIFESLK